MAVATKDKLVTLEALKAVNDHCLAKTGDTMTGSLRVNPLSRIADANTGMTDDGYVLLRCDSNTLNTPATQGLTNTTNAYLLQFKSGAYATQFYFGNARDIVYVRRLSNGTWADWVQCVSPEKRVTYTMSVDVTNAVIGRRCAVDYFTLPSGVNRNNIKAIYVSKNTNASLAVVAPTINDPGTSLVCGVIAAGNTFTAEIEITVVY